MHIVSQQSTYCAENMAVWPPICDDNTTYSSMYVKLVLSIYSDIYYSKYEFAWKT